MNDTVSATPKKMSVKTIAVIGVLTAVTCILAPLSIPIGDVPISLTNLVIYFGLYILGTRRETVSYIVYLLIGLVGVPVFSGFTAGPAKMFGPTGGYLIGFIPMAVIAGIFIEKSGRILFDFICSFIIFIQFFFSFRHTNFASEAIVSYFLPIYNVLT